MFQFLRLAIATGLVLAIILGLTGLVLRGRGFSAREKPTFLETFVARQVRRLAVPRHARDMENPVPPSAEFLADAREHFADHCAICHANDGSGDTAIGRNLYPPAPDMRERATQSLSDGELFYAIHNGIRLTGMPAWGSGPVEEDTGSWKLVHFIRHLNSLSTQELAEMERMNPISRHQLEQEGIERAFLEGGAPSEERGGHHH